MQKKQRDKVGHIFIVKDDIVAQINILRRHIRMKLQVLIFFLFINIDFGAPLLT